MKASAQPVAVLLIADSEDRSSLLRSQLSMLLPGAMVRQLTNADIGEGALQSGDAALIDADVGASAGDSTVAAKKALQPATLLRARGFIGPIIVVTNAPDEKALSDAAEAMGVVALFRDRCHDSPTALAKALSSAFQGDTRVTPALVRARRVFAAGQAALSLQHAINNPMAALMAEAQLLQMEELNGEQRGSVDRIVELCRRISVLVRQLDALADG